MKIKYYILIAFLCIPFTLIPVSTVSAIKSSVRDYRVVTTQLFSADKKFTRIAIRRFRMYGKEYYFSVNPSTLETEIVPVGKYLILKRSLSDLRSTYGHLAYFKAMSYAESNSRRLQNAGIVHVPGKGQDLYMTADLCPTKMLMDRLLFSRLLSDYGSVHKPVPVAIAVSGVWIEKHQNDLKWLIDLSRKKDLAILWMNHTYNHKYNKRVPWWRNFLLDKDASVPNEIIQNEIAMIETGIVPSVFFRFPGLVSNKSLVMKVTDCGLIPIGSDAWLGKKQWPEYGSIILVHANGQEPVGIKRLFWILEAKNKEIAAGRWVLADLRAGILRAMKMY
jgi:hypothetical protein